MGFFSAAEKTVVYVSIGMTTYHTVQFDTGSEAKTYLNQLLDKLNSSDNFIVVSADCIIRKDKINYIELRYP